MTSSTVVASARTFEKGSPERSGLAPIRLMIVDDSAVARTVLSRMISAHKQFEVIALAADAADAIEQLHRVKVDIVLLDVEMPGPSGIDALPAIVEAGAGAQVLIVSSNCEEGAEATVRALALGAADTLPKPGAGTFVGKFADLLVERLHKLARASREDWAAAEAEARRAQLARFRPVAIEQLGCVAIGASTGGLHALNEFFAALPPVVDVPILITQHLPPVFMPYFAKQIQAASGRPTRVAASGMRLQRGEILVAPGDAHLSVRRRGNSVCCELVEAPAISGCMPSVDTMFAGVSDVYGQSGLGIVLSGMGRDGLLGSRSLTDRGGTVIVQDQHSCAVWGMPRSVADAGLASAILPPSDLAMMAGAIAEGVSWM